MDESGVDYPTKKIRERKNEPGGVSVKPGTYRTVMSFGDQTSEEQIIVKPDPRLNVSEENTNVVYTRMKQLQAMQQTAADAVKQLVESKNVAADFQKRLKKLDEDNNEKKYKSEIKASKEIIKSIDSIVAIFLGKEDKRQGITRNPEVTAMQRLGQARSYVSSMQNGITSTETNLIDNAKYALEAGLNKTNTFFSEEWKTYRAKMEALEMNPFKEIENFSIDRLAP